MFGSVWFPLSHATPTRLSYFRKGFWVKYNLCLLKDWELKDVLSLVSWMERNIFQSLLLFVRGPTVRTKYSHWHLR